MDTAPDFFVSFTRDDIEWARWITWVLEEEGFQVVFQELDMRPGHNIARQMQTGTSATRTIAVLSPAYTDRPFPLSEWAAAFVQDPDGLARKLIPVRVEECSPPGLLAPIVYIDLVGVERDEARQRLLSGIQSERPRVVAEPPFPGGR
ncbi:toll/interleukin-1 receptor domain-containing protein [Lentzea sp. NPDC051213]|uniref:toll/interleukin-1 receptor domain-containing protein n=1 Tax=Lentzea sp. NPDC051213 TaxID=3364126 RepID=UPI0037A5031D